MFDDKFENARAEALEFVSNMERTVISKWLECIGKSNEPLGYYRNIFNRTMVIYTRLPGCLIGKAGKNRHILKEMLSEEFGGEWDVRFEEVRGGFLNMPPTTQNKNTVNNRNIKIARVNSADRRYLISSIILIILIIGLELISIYNFMTSDLKSEAVVVIFILQIPVLLVGALSVILLAGWKDRTEFNLYFCKIDDADISYIKKNYYVHKIDDYGILFADRKDIHNCMTWNIVQGYESLRAVETMIFKV